MQSSFEWCRERSRYHWDLRRRDRASDYVHHMGRFEGDWQAEVAAAISQTHSVTWSNRKNYLGEQRQSPMLAQELLDLDRAGADPDLVLTDRVDDVAQFPTLQRMVNWFGLDPVRSQIHVQRTGQMFNWHIDKLYEYADDPADVYRFVIMLEDWQPGQFYCYGTYQYTHWQAGDFHWFDWQDVPHATANASLQPRATLQATGRASDITRQRVSGIWLDPVLV
jgi:hypothetical protein